MKQCLHFWGLDKSYIWLKNEFWIKALKCNILKSARDKGLIKVIGGGNARKGFGKGRYPYLYEITSLGRRYLKDMDGKYL